VRTCFLEGLKYLRHGYTSSACVPLGHLYQHLFQFIPCSLGDVYSYSRKSYLPPNHEDVSLNFCIRGCKNSLQFPIVQISDSASSVLHIHSFDIYLYPSSEICGSSVLIAARCRPVFIMSWAYTENTLSPRNKVLRKMGFLCQQTSFPGLCKN